MRTFLLLLIITGLAFLVAVEPARGQALWPPAGAAAAPAVPALQLGPAYGAAPTVGNVGSNPLTAPVSIPVGAPVSNSLAAPAAGMVGSNPVAAPASSYPVAAPVATAAPVTSANANSPASPGDVSGAPQTAIAQPAIAQPAIAQPDIAQPDGPADSRLTTLCLPARDQPAEEGWLMARAQPADGSTRPQPTYAPNTDVKGLWDATCDDCVLRGFTIFVSYDSFRGLSDGGWQNNGLTTGFNYGTRLGWLSDKTGIGLQMGGSAAVYNWDGTDYRPQSGGQSQGFVTYGLFRKPTVQSHWSAAFLQDWMLNSNFGEYSQNPTLSQWRAQVAYAISVRNEFGLWGTQRFLNDYRNIPSVGPAEWRAINQLNFFWHYKWAPGGADTYLWIGKPENDRLGSPGSLGDYTVGASANVPLNDQIALYSTVQYMHPSARVGPAGGEENEWNFTIGLAWYPSRNARSSTVAGQCWMPAMSVANNATFLVDTNRH